MSKEYFTQFSIDEVSFIVDFFTSNIVKYKLAELTNGYCGDLPSINKAHPLALEYGNALAAGEDGNYTSILPAIGIELLDDGDSNQQMLGGGQQTIEITEDLLTEIEAISQKDRIDNGILMSDTVLENLKTMRSGLLPNKLYAKSNRYLQEPTVEISIWSNNLQVTKILRSIIKSLLKRLIREMSKVGAKVTKTTSQNSLFNYEFGEILFGAEFSMNLINVQMDFEIDDELVAKISDVEEYFNVPSVAGPTFVEKT